MTDRTRRDRRRIVGGIVVVVVALLVAVGAFGVRAWNDRGPAERDPAPVAAAVRAVGEFLTMSYDDSEARRAEVAALLTGPLAADYRASGPNAVFPGAVASRLATTGDVTDAALAVGGDTAARVLVFADQTITVRDGDREPWTVAGARWAWMSQVDGRWLLSRLESAAPQ